MTAAAKRVTRHCLAPFLHRHLIVTIGPGDLLELRPERTRQSEFIPLTTVYSLAVKLRLAAGDAGVAARRKERNS